MAAGALIMIDHKTIEKIAQLARLNLSQEEIVAQGQQLEKVLKHFDQIAKINTENIQPLVTPADIEFYARPDEAIKETTTEEILANAPDKAGNLFKVPPVV